MRRYRRCVRSRIRGIVLGASPRLSRPSDHTTTVSSTGEQVRSPFGTTLSFIYPNSTPTLRIRSRWYRGRKKKDRSWNASARTKGEMDDIEYEFFLHLDSSQVISNTDRNVRFRLRLAFSFSWNDLSFGPWMRLALRVRNGDDQRVENDRSIANRRLYRLSFARVRSKRGARTEQRLKRN